jgi:hypothetical protein
MAGEIQLAHSETGVTLYAQLRNRTGQIYNTAGAVFEAYLTANIADYDIAMVEQGTASRYYVGTMPVVASSYYLLTVLKRAGGAPAEADVFVGEGDAFWNGTVLFAMTEIVNAMLDLAATIDTFTLRQIGRLLAAANGGKTSGAITTDFVRAVDDSKTRIDTVIDGNGHRTSVILDLT